MNTETDIVTDLAHLDNLCTVDHIATTMMKIDSLIRRAKEFRAQFDQACIDWIVLNGRDIEIACDDDGHKIRLYIANPKDKKNRDASKTLHTLLEVSGGDEEAVVNCLSANAWKPGTVKKLLEENGQGERFDELFETVERTVLEEGKPKKQLQKFDERFLQPR